MWSIMIKYYSLATICIRMNFFLFTTCLTFLNMIVSISLGIGVSVVTTSCGITILRDCV